MGKANRKKPLSYHRPPPNSKLPYLSGALMELVAPLYNHDMPLEMYRNLIGYAAFAWTLAQFPKEVRKRQLQAFFKLESKLKLTFDEIVELNSDEEMTADPSPDMNLIRLIKAFVHRKEQLYPDDRRIPREWDVFFENGEYRVRAAYVTPETPADSPAAE